jgi:chlorobactene glucosyltransferase
MTAYFLVLAAVALLATYNFFCAYRLETFSGRDDEVDAVSVSVLVPVRNEARNLPALLQRLEAIAFRRLEILLLDDESDDASLLLLEHWARRQHQDVRVLRGLPRPRGWVGKNWACWQLAEAARGNVLLFVDADVRPSNVAVRRTVEAMLATDADALTGIPHQRMGSWLERLVVPMVMHFAPAALLPLRWLAAHPTPRAVFANGQWLAVRREVYFAVGGHRRVHNSVLDDVALGRAVVAGGGVLVPVVATRDLAVRMYDGAPALVRGFGKNLAALAGGHFGTVLLVAVVWTLLFALPLPLALSTGRWDVLGVGLLTPVAVLATFRRPLHEIVLVPFGALATVVLLFFSWGWTRSGRAVWRGRPLTPREN